MVYDNKDLEVFASKYQKEEKEILVLMSDAPGTAGKGQGENLWSAQKYFLAYFDLNTNELKNGDGRVSWPITEEERQKYGVDWPYKFRGGVIYRLKVRALIDKTVPDGMMPSYFNRFMVVEILEEDVHNDALLHILAEYRKPIIIEDKTLGKFELNKDLELFEGRVNWLGKDISVSLEVTPDSKSTWTKAMNVLRTLFEEQKQKDSEFRAFAAEQLTELANDWRQDEDTAEITKQSFIDRISLSELSIASGGSFTAFYNDDDMFAGHAVTVYGNIKKGLKSTNIEG